MALSIGKLTILVGAGIFGSVLAREGALPDVPSFVSSAFKIALRQIKSDPSTSASKPRNDSLMAQVNSLRQEIEMLSINKPITIVTTSGKGATKYGVVIVVVVGCGYVWLKGWKLPDMMFATRRGLSDACTTIAHQLENVYASIRKTRRQLSADIDRVDSNLNEVARLTSDTQEKVTELRDESARIGDSFRNVRNVVETLEEKISRIEGKQDLTTLGVKKLVHIANNMEANMIEQNMQAASSNSIISFSSKPGALPPPSPTSSEPSTPFDLSVEVQRSQQDTTSRSTSSQQSSPGISGVVDASSSSDGIRVLEEPNNSGSTWSFLSRTRSITNALLLRTGSSKQQS